MTTPRSHVFFATPRSFASHAPNASDAPSPASRQVLRSVVSGIPMCVLRPAIGSSWNLEPWGVMLAGCREVSRSFLGVETRELAVPLLVPWLLSEKWVLGGDVASFVFVFWLWNVLHRTRSRGLPINPVKCDMSYATFVASCYDASDALVNKFGLSSSFRPVAQIYLTDSGKCPHQRPQGRPHVHHICAAPSTRSVA